MTDTNIHTTMTTFARRLAHAGDGSGIVTVRHADPDVADVDEPTVLTKAATLASTR